MNEINPRPFYYSQIRVDPNDADRVYVLGGRIAVSEDSGETFENLQMNVHVDHHDLWINPENSDHLVLGNDGGIYFSFDRGKNWDFLNQMAIGQVYAIDVDMQKPYYIYGGVQDYCSWAGPSATRNTIGITEADWYKVMTGDGFQVRIDPEDHNILFAEAQYGRIIRHDARTGQNTMITPTAPEGAEEYRFNWETPIHISYHDTKTLYAGGNHVFRSPDRGASWEMLSPDLTTATRSRPDYREGEPQKIASISVFAESPLNANLLYAGTDDGHVHVTRDGGGSWIQTEDFPLAGPRWVSRIVASRFDENRAYASFDGHRNDDFSPYVFETTNAGQSWTSIAANLPGDHTVRVLREDVKNPNLLFVGTEFAAFVSFDRGKEWIRLMNGMPTVPVADLVVHPRDGDLIAGTHGRSAYVMDISPLQELNAEVASKDLHLFSVKDTVAFRYRGYSDDQFLGEKRFVASNPPYGATISYLLSPALAGPETAEPTTDNGDNGSESDGNDDDKEAKVKLVVTDARSNIVRELEGPRKPGIQRVQWDLRYPTPEREQQEERRGFGGPLRGPLVEPGTYQVRLEVDGHEVSTPVRVEADPELQIAESDREKRWPPSSAFCRFRRRSKRRHVAEARSRNSSRR